MYAGILGDSRSDSAGIDSKWPDSLIVHLNALDNPLETWHMNRPWQGWAASGQTTAGLKDVIDAELLRHPDIVGATKNIALINIGANDNEAAGVESTWKANYQYIIDALTVKWPDIQIYCAIPWFRTKYWVNDSLAVWIPEVVADNPNCHLGHNERVWLEGGDNGATMTYDGLHYSAAGNAECVNQWKTILGY